MHAGLLCVAAAKWAESRPRGDAPASSTEEARLGIDKTDADAAGGLPPNASDSVTNISQADLPTPAPAESLLGVSVEATTTNRGGVKRTGATGKYYAFDATITPGE